VLVAALGWSGWLSHLHIAGRATPVDYLEAALTDIRPAAFTVRSVRADL
jgi:adenylate cyclase